MTPVILFVFGTVVGSFLNVVGLRWNAKDFGGRSKCPKCGKTLKWYELIPVFSFLFLRGKCSKCSGKISWLYPIVEIWTGLIFATVPLIFLPVFCLYIVITIYDLHHKIIPDPLVYIAITLSLIYGYENWFVGLLLFSFFASIWFLSRGRAMGFGDAKLALSIGLLLGLSQGIYALILSFWLGALIGIILMQSKKINITMKSEIPFAPFLVLGAWLSLIFHFNFLYVV
ncbi:MAG TPA: prepilin peptidase [Candidatus Paceibacterota bacterium]